MVAVNVPVLVGVEFRAFPVYRKVAGSVSVKSADDIQKGGFSAPGRTENGHEFAFSEFKRDAFQRGDGFVRRVIFFYYVFEF